jgi:L-aminopeptidase/D-esterase-like protein
MSRPRARDLGIPFEGTPGPQNAITDVSGVEVGHSTLISGSGALHVGVGPVRTGVTAVLPRGKAVHAPVFAGWFSLNGNGEMTGTAWLDEAGLLSGPILLTNTHSVGTVRDAVIAWQLQNSSLPGGWSLPVVAETFDGWLNDVNGFHVKAEHVFAALEQAAAGPVAEGNVGGGTGMICHGFKGGIGTASRRTQAGSETYTVGALVQANHGAQHQLRIAGAPVGLEWAAEAASRSESGSIIGLVATDAPLLPHQLKALAKRAALGMARTGGVAGISSGDLFLAFSTANLADANPAETIQVTLLGLNRISALFEATAQATEEAIINALIAAETMIGRDDHQVIALPHDWLRQILRKYNRLSEH